MDEEDDDIKDFENFKKRYAKKLDEVSKNFHSVKDFPIPEDVLVTIKTDEGFISEVYYNDFCKEAFKDWIPISWITSDELDKIL